jgi:hypothetical protein
MRPSDLPAFGALLDGACALLSRGAYTPNPTSTAIFFSALREHDMATVRAAFEAHCRDPQRGRFAPTPADILAQVEQASADDGRTEDAEAWATALRASDEGATVVWTAETAEAWGICKPVLDAGDEVGARMAFKAAYNRLLVAARARREPIRWSASIGHDTARRDDALRIAVDGGRLPVAYLPAPRGPVAGLLELSQQRGCPPEVRDRLLQIRSQIAAGDAGQSEDAAAKARTASAKEIAADAVRRYQDGAA